MGDRIRVLHVDDEPGFADMAATFLEREDDRFEVETATSVSDGVDELAETNFDCIVSDYDMPRRDGVEFLDAVHADHPDLPFILYTGKGSEEIASEAISAGVTDYLQKGRGPDQYTVLANRITNAFEYQRSQQALTERNQELRSYERMINSMQEAACIYDEDGRFTIVNEFLADWYGTTRDALEGERSKLITHIRDRADGDPYQELLDGEREEYRGQFESEFPGHGHAVVEYRLTPMTMEDSVEGIVGVARDVTGRREREHKFERARDLLERTERIADVGGWEIDTETMEVFWTEHLFDLLGARYDDEPPLDEALDVYHEEDRPIVENAVEAALDSGDPFDVEVRFRRPDDEIRWLKVQGVPTIEDGEVVTLRGAVQDITDRKNEERELERQNERLEKFSSFVSHDLQNPLMVADGRLELASEECDSEHLEHVTRAHERMKALIDDLLTLAREGTQVGRLDSVDLGDLVENCWQHVDTAEARIVTGTERTIRADRSRIQQLLENLMRNAVEHGGEDVTVTVGGLDDGFYVEDDGPGIPPEEREDVLRSGYSNSEEGTGFGLTIVERMAEAHDWELHVTESTDGGARIEVTGVESDQ